MDIDTSHLTHDELRQLKALSQRSDSKGLVHFTSHLAAIALCAWALQHSLGSVFMAPALIVQGLLLVFLFAPLHETLHRTAFRSRWLNDCVAFVLGALLLLPSHWFRAFHFAHHRFTQDPALDPELAFPKPSTWRQYLIHVSGYGYWSGQVQTLFRLAFSRQRQPYETERERPALAREARILLALYGLIALLSFVFQSWSAILFWLGPLLLGQPFLRLYLLAEHWSCPLIPNMLANSRTTRSNPLVRWLAWNMPYHAEHHSHPALPFHALPKAHALLAPKIQITAKSYSAVQRDYWRALKG